MVNLIAFVNMFLSYLLVFVIFIVVIIAAVFVGIKLRKNKNKKEELLKEAENTAEVQA